MTSVPVAQLDRVPASEAGCGSSSLPGDANLLSDPPELYCFDKVFQNALKTPEIIFGVRPDIPKVFVIGDPGTELLETTFFCPFYHLPHQANIFLIYYSRGTGRTKFIRNG